MSRQCSVPGCERAAHSRGWCTLHYGRWKRSGDPLTFKPPQPDIPGMYSSQQTLQMLDGRLSYRMLDYWCREGWIAPTQDTSGSGTPRLWSATDIEALRQMLDVVDEIAVLSHSLSSGALWAKLHPDLKDDPTHEDRVETFPRSHLPGRRSGLASTG